MSQRSRDIKTKITETPCLRERRDSNSPITQRHNIEEIRTKMTLHTGGYNSSGGEGSRISEIQDQSTVDRGACIHESLQRLQELPTFASDRSGPGPAERFLRTMTRRNSMPRDVQRSNLNQEIHTRGQQLIELIRTPGNSGGPAAREYDIHRIKQLIDGAITLNPRTVRDDTTTSESRETATSQLEENLRDLERWEKYLQGESTTRPIDNDTQNTLEKYKRLMSDGTTFINRHTNLLTQERLGITKRDYTNNLLLDTMNLQQEANLNPIKENIDKLKAAFSQFKEIRNELVSYIKESKLFDELKEMDFGQIPEFAEIRNEWKKWKEEAPEREEEKRKWE